ncbi:conserved hypothetical protein [Burkholderia sp. 8Y]|uniref:hypothetical protein n=1 Tax=Burkholderia sp. 8Y TaxID=2653133 RepID=UPI0012F30881|nr:hypothetical protein [Burkholderia sp. 8Y]VXC72883.1 conserved hypothetical protein [Burkholderia sp. 8Y]
MIIYVLRTEDGLQYCAQLDYREHPARNAILMAALELGLTVTLRADATHHITDVAATLPNVVPLPALGHTWRLLEDVRTGAVVQAEDANMLGSLAYIIRSPDGSHHCVQVCPNERGYRTALLMAAFRAKLPVTVAGDPDYFLTALSVGSRAFGPNINCAPGFISTTPRSGLIDEIIDTEAADALSVVVKTPEATRYHVRMDRQEHANRHHLAMLALRSGLPVTVSANEEHYVTGIAVGALSADAAPSMILFGQKLTGMQTGSVLRIIDADALDEIRYVLRAPDGAHYCARMNTTKHASRHQMLMTALALHLPVSITADANSVITGVSVGLPHRGSPTFHCQATRFPKTETGSIVRMIDSDALGPDTRYVLATPDGDEWAVPAFARGQPGRGPLLALALTGGLAVTVNGIVGSDTPLDAGSLTVARR